MGKAHRFLWLALFIVLVSSVFAQTSQNTQTSEPTQVVVSKGLSPEDKAYFDGLNQKTVAQLSAKIDAQANAMETNLRTEVDQASQMIRMEVSADIKGALKVIAFGLGGVIIIVLALFRIIEYRLNHTKRIKKYEEELEQKKKEFEEGLKAVNVQKEELAKLQKELLVYKQGIDKYAMSLGVQPQINIEKQALTKENFDWSKAPQPPVIKKKSLLKEKLKGFFTKKNILRLVLVIIMISLVIFFANKYLFGAKVV